MAREKTVNAAIYCRISLDMTGEEQGVERQEAACRKWARENKWKVVHVYVDNSVSASNPRKRCPEYDQMVADIEAGTIDAVIVWDIDRLTRQPDQLSQWCAFAEDGIVIAEAKGGPDAIDLRNGAARLMLRVRADFAEYETRHKGERQRFANRQRALNGTYFGGVRPIGYTRDAQLIPHEAKAVSAVFSAYVAGATVSEIARALSGDKCDRTKGIPTLPRPSRTQALEYNERHPDRPKEVPAAQPWNNTGVMHMLRNPRYAGIVSYKSLTRAEKEGHKGWYPAEFVDDGGKTVYGTWEAIVPEVDWRRAQALLDDHRARRQKAPAKVRQHLGTSLFKCSVCGEPLHVMGSCYYCNGHVCRSQPGTDRYVRDVIVARLSRKDALSGLAVKDGRRPRDFDAEVRAQQKRVERAQRDYDDEVIEAVDLKRIREKARTEIARIEAERAARATEAAESAIPAEVLNAKKPAEAFLALPLEGQRKVIDYLAAVFILPGRGKRTGFVPAQAVDIRWKE